MYLFGSICCSVLWISHPTLHSLYTFCVFLDHFLCLYNRTNKTLRGIQTFKLQPLTWFSNLVVLKVFIAQSLPLTVGCMIYIKLNFKHLLYPFYSKTLKVYKQRSVSHASVCSKQVLQNQLCINVYLFNDSIQLNINNNLCGLQQLFRFPCHYL